jgi:hypothetical protein
MRNLTRIPDPNLEQITLSKNILIISVSYDLDEIHCDLIFDETPRPISPLSICHPPFPLARFGSSGHSTFRTKEQILSNLRVCGSFFWAESLRL